MSWTKAKKGSSSHTKSVLGNATDTANKTTGKAGNTVNKGLDSANSGVNKTVGGATGMLPEAANYLPWPEMNWAAPQNEVLAYLPSWLTDRWRAADEATKAEE